jgi:hypothetical protein
LEAAEKLRAEELRNLQSSPDKAKNRKVLDPFDGYLKFVSNFV